MKRHINLLFFVLLVIIYSCGGGTTSNNEESAKESSEELKSQKEVKAVVMRYQIVMIFLIATKNGSLYTLRFLRNIKRTRIIVKRWRNIRRQCPRHPPGRRTGQNCTPVCIMKSTRKDSRK